MPKTVEPSSAGRRLLGSELSFAGAFDHSEIAVSTDKIQSRVIAARYGLPPATAAAIAALAYPSVDSWRARA